MKIYFDNVQFSSLSGPNSFGKRLSDHFIKMGHEVAKEGEEHDIFLSFIQKNKNPCKNAKTVLRLDGIWFKPENFEENNKKIKEAYLSYDYVIFQSYFDKIMIQKYFGERDDCFVIHNGIEISKKNIVHQIKHSNEKIFVCSANWHPQKRLKENVALFSQIRKKLNENGEDARLYILGNCHDFESINFCNLDNVFYLGHQNHETCLRFYATADYFIHLAWLDHCPNVVVEALSQGCPVICTNSGGTSEIVRESGIIIPETKSYNFELTDYDCPYPVDFSTFDLPKLRPIVDSEHLNIEKVAESYINVFKGIKI